MKNNEKQDLVIFGAGGHCKIVLDTLFELPVIIHPKAYVSNLSEIKAGSFIGAGAIIQPGVLIKENVIVNEGSYIGAGSTIIQNIKIGKNVLIGAGSLFVKDVDDNTKIFNSQSNIIKNNAE